MTASHISKTIQQIHAMRGPFEGELLVELTGPHGFALLDTPKNAVQFVQDNPRQEFKATEKWLLS